MNVCISFSLKTSEILRLLDEIDDEEIESGDIVLHIPDESGRAVSVLHIPDESGRAVSVLHIPDESGRADHI